MLHTYLWTCARIHTRSRVPPAFLQMWGRTKSSDDAASAAPVGDVSVPTAPLDATGATDAAGATDGAVAAATGTAAADATGAPAGKGTGAGAGAGASSSQPRGKVKGFGSKFRVGRGRSSSADDALKSTSSTVERNRSTSPSSPGE